MFTKAKKGISDDWKKFMGSKPYHKLGGVLRTVWAAVLKFIGWLAVILVPLLVACLVFFGVVLLIVLAGDKVGDGIDWAWDNSEADKAWNETLEFLDIREAPVPPMTPAEAIEATAEADRQNAEATIEAIEQTAEAEREAREAEATRQAEATTAALNATATAEAQQAEIATAQARATEQAEQLELEQREAEAQATEAAMPPTPTPEPTAVPTEEPTPEPTATPIDTVPVVPIGDDDCNDSCN